MPSTTRPHHPPRTDDSLAAPLGPSESLATLVDNFLKLAYNEDPGGKGEYEAALADMRKNASRVVVTIARAEAKCRRDDYPLRWALIYAAAQLNHVSALAFLRDVVTTPIPPERSVDPHSFSTVGQETVLRTTAAEGIGRLAAKGSKEAVEALFEFLSIPSLSIRRAAVQAILAQNPKWRKKVAGYLPFDQRHLLEIAPRKVTEVTQIDHPERDLRANRPVAASKPTPPTLSDDAHEGGEPPRRVRKGR